VRQFHKEAVPSTAGDGQSAESTTREYVLGVYGAGTEVTVAKAGGEYVLQQSYSAGSEGRSVAVQYDCDSAALIKGGASYEIIGIEEPQPLHYVLTVATRDAALCSLLPSPTRVLAPLNKTCIEHVEGWWTYEICIGGTIRQYHSENGKAVQESVIGVWDLSHGQTLENNALVSGGAIVQKYTKGTACEVRKGVTRQATLRFECLPPSGAAAAAAEATAGSDMHGKVGFMPKTVTLTLQSIKEGPTCEYTISFGTPIVCEHPDAVPAQKAVTVTVPRPVYCVPEADEDIDEDDEGGTTVAAREPASTEATHQPQEASSLSSSAVVQEDGSAHVVP
jgi:hypothetical protein